MAQAKNIYFKAGSRNRSAASRVQPLNQRNIAGTLERVRQFVQDEKIQISLRTITKFQYQDRWPDEYNSFVISERKNNLYKDPAKFFKSMHDNPKFYNRKFIFRPLNAEYAKYIRLATIDAHRLIIEQLQRYIAARNVSGTPNISTGHYATMIQLAVDGRPLSSVSQLNNLTSNSVVSIMNTAEYAARAESVAYYYAGIQGIFYYAAKMVGKRYPMLALRFSFVRTNRGGRPRLLIGTSENVNYKLQKPRDGTYDSATGRRTSSYRAKFAPGSTAAKPIRT